MIRLHNSQLLAIMAAFPQEQLLEALERLMVNRKIAASKAKQVFEEAMTYRRNWIVKS